MNRLRMRVDAILPGAKCFIRGDKIVKWLDARPQPSDAELSAIDVDAIVAAEEAEKQEVTIELDTNILSGKTFQDVDNFIDNQFSSATTVAGVKTVLISVLKIYGKLILAIAKRQGLSK